MSNEEQRRALWETLKSLEGATIELYEATVRASGLAEPITDAEKALLPDELREHGRRLYEASSQGTAPALIEISPLVYRLTRYIRDVIHEPVLDYMFHYVEEGLRNAAGGDIHGEVTIPFDTASFSFEALDRNYPLRIKGFGYKPKV